MTSEELTEIFKSEFPIKGDLASLEFVEVVPRDDSFAIVIRLIVWDEKDGKQSIRDIKEQQIYFNAPDDVTFERLVAFMRGLDAALAPILAKPETVETLMPHDLLSFAALKLKTANTEDEFAQALRAKSRLGKFLLAS